MTSMYLYGRAQACGLAGKKSTHFQNTCRTVAGKSSSLIRSSLASENLHEGQLDALERWTERTGSRQN